MRAAATDQNVAFRWRVQGFRQVRDGAGDQSALALMTDAGTTGPSDGHIARLCQLKNGLAVAAPWRRNPAACEGNKWAHAWSTGRLVRNAPGTWRRHAGRE